jgi:hypothetical protein
MSWISGRLVLTLKTTGLEVEQMKELLELWELKSVGKFYYEELDVEHDTAYYEIILDKEDAGKFCMHIPVENVNGLIQDERINSFSLKMKSVLCGDDY